VIKRESEFNKVPANISLKIRILNVKIITGPITSTNSVVLNSYFHFTFRVLIRAWLLETGIRTNNYPCVQLNTVQVFYIFRHVCKIAEQLRAFPCLSICLSTWKNSAPTSRIFMKFDISGFLKHLSRKFKFH
jgi:hypothetical protein